MSKTLIQIGVPEMDVIIHDNLIDIREPNADGVRKQVISNNLIKQARTCSSVFMYVPRGNGFIKIQLHVRDLAKIMDKVKEIDKMIEWTELKD